MATANKIQKIAAERNITEEQLIRDLMQEHRTPFKAAISVDLYPYAIRRMLKKYGWQNVDGEWVEPIKQSA